MKRCSKCDREYDDSATFCASDGEPLTDPFIGLLLDGKYELERLLGCGGMGSVYIGRHKEINKKVAIKIILKERVNEPISFERFKREAIAAAAIKHPNIVPVNDFGKTADGLAYMVMECVDGVSLRRLIEEEKRLSPERTVDLGRQICAALSAAHRAGIVHRDMKPDNVMIEIIDGKETARVLDFGIAKLKDTKQNLTVAGSVVGTPYYMSPEQCGAGGEVDQRSDIYSVGVMLYQMLSGEVPFDAPSGQAVMVKHVVEAPKPLKEVCLDIPESLARVVMRAMEKDPKDRRQTAAELSNELKVALEKIEEPPPPIQADVFISYSDKDRERVLQIVEQLKAAGIRLWMDSNRDEGNGIYNPAVEEAIKNSKFLMVMSSNASMRSRMVKQDLQLAWKYERACMPLSIEKVGFFNQIKYWLEGQQPIEVKDIQSGEWLPQVLQALGHTGVELQSVEQTNGAQQKSVSVSTSHRGLGAPQSGIVANPSGSIDQPTQIKQTLDGLRSIAKFTDQIWPLPANRVQRGATRSALRGLGAPQEDVQHGHSLGSRVCLAIESEREGHLLLLDEGPEGIIYCLSPSWFAPNTGLQPGRIYLPQAGSRYDSFVVSGKPGREHLLAIITEEPLGLNWMPTDPKIPARELNQADLEMLITRLRSLPADSWTALSTYFDVIA